MISKRDISGLPVANYDSDRKGIFIHRNQLSDSGFNVGDRFSVKVGKQDLFAISIDKDDKGDIVFDKNGIFIERTRRVDMFLGGVFDVFADHFYRAKTTAGVTPARRQQLVQRFRFDLVVIRRDAINRGTVGPDDPEQRQWLERLTHPLIGEEILNQLQQASSLA